MKNKSTIYAKNSDGIYKIIHIEVKEDDSLHIYFPRKNGYFVRSKQDIDLGGFKSKKFTFESNIKGHVYEPYFSYHPGKSVVHFNAKDSIGNKIPFIKDRRSSNIKDLIDNEEFAPLMTIVIPPKMNVFDKVTSLRKHNLLLNVPRNHVALSLEILIHGKGGYVDKDNLPFKEKRNVSFICHLNDKLTNNLSYTLVLNNILIESENDIPSEIFAIAWNQEMPIGISLSANN